MPTHSCDHNSFPKPPGAGATYICAGCSNLVSNPTHPTNAASAARGGVQVQQLAGGDKSKGKHTERTA